MALMWPPTPDCSSPQAWSVGLLLFKRFFIFTACTEPATNWIWQPPGAVLLLGAA